MVALVAHVFPLMSCLDNFPHSGIKVLWHLASEMNSGEFFVSFFLGKTRTNYSMYIIHEGVAG